MSGAPHVADSGDNSGFCGMLDAAMDWFHSVNIHKLKKVIKLANVSVAIVLALVYPYAFATGGLDMTFQAMILCAYAMFFSLLLLAFEFKVNKMHSVLKRLFGFMFSFFGRTVFLCFIGTLAIAGGWYGCQVVGIFAMAVSLLNCCAIYNHPGHLEITQNENEPEPDDDDDMAVSRMHGRRQASHVFDDMEMKPVDLDQNQSFVVEEDLTLEVSAGAVQVATVDPFSQATFPWPSHAKPTHI